MEPDVAHADTPLGCRARPVIYFSNPCSPAVREAMTAGEFACIVTPKQHNPVPPDSLYCCDNGKFGKGWPGFEKWFAWLKKTVETYGPERCLFATAPDVVGDAVETLIQSSPWLTPMRELGVPVAYVAQDGCQDAPGLIPWAEFDVLFVGGSTEFKLGSEALCREAIERGKRVHIGRVNSYKRMQWAKDCGAESCDGTFIKVAPDINLPRARRWFEKLH